jgi:hypothetical protein
MRRAVRPDATLDLALFNLRRLGLPYVWRDDDLRRWDALCPTCRKWPLVLFEAHRGASVTLTCEGGGCDPGAVAWSLSADPLQWHVDALEAELADALNLADHARDVAHQALELAAARVGREAQLA